MFLNTYFVKWASYSSLIIIIHYFFLYFLISNEINYLFSASIVFFSGVISRYLIFSKFVFKKKILELKSFKNFMKNIFVIYFLYNIFIFLSVDFLKINIIYSYPFIILMLGPLNFFFLKYKW